jgi:hypothetical protein
VSNGGTAVIDFQVSWDQGSNGSFILLTSLQFIADQYLFSYTTSEALISGKAYKFMVTAKNQVGPSAPTYLTVIAAAKPSKPEPPTAINSLANVLISWLEPANGGSPITSYIVKIYDKNFSL